MPRCYGAWLGAVVGGRDADVHGLQLRFDCVRHFGEGAAFVVVRR
jgi:hypothetical protein